MPATDYPNSVSNPLDKSPLIKMKDLVSATGVSKATILYYINEGLLPKPVKTNPNVSYYPESFIEKIGFIKQLQNKHRLRLAQIKAVLKEQEKGHEVTPLIELNEVVFGKKEEVNYSFKEFAKQAGLKVQDVKKAIELNLLNPKSEAEFDAEDLAMARMLKRSIELGLTLDELDFYPKLAAEIVEKEIEIRKKLINKKSFEDIMAITLEITGIARSFRGYVIDRIFQEKVKCEKI